MDYSTLMEAVRNARMDVVVETSGRLFIERGIDSVRMTDIANQCNVGVASLYRYFGTKQRLVVVAASQIWSEINKLFEGVFESDYYLSKSGVDRVHELLKVFIVLLEGHADFLRFIRKFDIYVINESIPAEELAVYEGRVMDSYGLFRQAFDTGLRDGTITPEVEPNSFYLTSTHALMSLCQKLTDGKILKSDSLITGGDEVRLLIDILIHYIKKAG